MQRSIGTSSSIALLLHALGLWAFSASPVSGHGLPIASEPPAPRALESQPRIDPPIAVEFVRIAPGPATTVSRQPEPATSASPARRRIDTGSAASRSSPKIAREAESEILPEPIAEPSAPSGRLRMRGDSLPELDPMRASGLAAAIAGAQGPEVAGPRTDLLGTPALPTSEPRVWRPSGNGTLRAEGQPFEAEVGRDGRIVFRDRPNVDARFGRIKLSEKRTLPLPILAGSFDVTDAVMASFGEVLYPYRKLKLMDESREERAQMALRYRDEVLESALTKYKRRLAKLWKNPEYELAARKKILFQLWDECAERGPEEVVKTAHSIRAMTLQFIRSRIPESHADAYSEAELDDLNRNRQSTRRFSPYR
jgi:hypothetical protein